MNIYVVMTDSGDGSYSDKYPVGTYLSEKDAKIKIEEYLAKTERRFIQELWICEFEVGQSLVGQV